MRNAHMAHALALTALIVAGACAASSVPAYDVWHGCPWQSPTNYSGKFQCFDGSFCSDGSAARALVQMPEKLYGSCCRERSGVAKCPPERPKMCAASSCPEGADWCCSKTCDEARACGQRGCVTVEIAAAAAHKGAHYLNSGVSVPLPLHCGSRCRLSICDEAILMLTTESLTPWVFSAGIAGAWADHSLTQAKPFMWDFRSTRTASAFGAAWEVPRDSGCCGPSSAAPLFEDTHNDGWTQCAAKCAERCHDQFPEKCSYIEFDAMRSTTCKCRAHIGTCVASSRDCNGTRTLQRVSLALGSGGALRTARCYTEPSWRSQHWWNFSNAFERCGSSAVCVQGHGCQNSCAADEECEGYPMRVCAGNGEAGKCKHKNIFGIGSGFDVGAASAFFVISGLALSAGIGGGGLYVPLLMLLLGFTAHEATGLSQALLTGGASSTLIYNMRQRHPSGSKPMIDYDLVLVMGPNLLIGAFVGSSLNMAAPSWLILVLLVFVLGHSAWKTLQKAFATLKRERSGDVRGMPAGDARLSKNVIERLFARVRSAFGRHSRLRDPEPSCTSQGENAADSACSTTGEMALDPSMISFGFDEDVEAAPADGDAAKAAAVLEQCAKAAAVPEPSADQKPAAALKAQPQYPCLQIMLFLCMWLVTLICIVARGGRASPGLVPYCSQSYWFLTGVASVNLALLSLLSARRAVANDGESNPEDGFCWTPAAARKVALCSLGAGTLAALCGIGGGMVMGPILLDIGVLPQVQSATTATTLLVLSSSAALTFLVQGAAPMDYALFLAVVTASGAVVGKAMVGFLVKLYRRPSALIFLLGGIILASVIIMTITGTIDVVNDISRGHDLGFKSICGMSLTD